jgi:hypothetical protein
MTARDNAATFQWCLCRKESFEINAASSLFSKPLPVATPRKPVAPMI